MNDATTNPRQTRVDQAAPTSSGTACPSWCRHHDDHCADTGQPMCFTPAVRIVLSDPRQADIAPTVYGMQVRGSESARVCIDRGDQPGFELTVTEAIRLAEAVLAALDEVTS